MPEILRFLLVFIVGLIASFLGINTGGGGLVSIPALIFLGFPPQIAIATNKFGSLGMSGTGLFRFHKSGEVDYKVAIPIAILSIIGAYFGANSLLTIPNQILEKIVGVLILAVLGVVLLDRKSGLEKKELNRPALKIFGYLSFLFVGFWGAFFGGGFAIFSSYILILIFGKTLIESAGTQQLLATGIAVMAVFIYGTHGIIDWFYGAFLIIGMSLGSYLGASYGIKKGDTWVKKLFVVMVLASTIKLIL
ncbi:hypothetical protein A2630_01300 [Candidatus Woesebacteria bacterium RIFCSPHIGHO2_01_FULL_44_10]|uniref:Probable membrane transporter protein n=1 Tax=Candidatus Woesebacteria bacterium RIFCSPLOWO2_01_FULL_44_14 TaxID=1802525 RepID=A0A1F8C1A5_9BACT|nr:MAG: hypothetical protein A2630_01300 [Candidatus Woesebacteria bacterium RIFCSPHIGHO2_01_FULL_44_10]OGM55677.1 MAG: hypothetical protein A3F62_02540 [Candidatus Woesebacteria bacterium RIFCSPHIGHO2_12_FULL_44_11]OGM70103.1 MAG: hypothetical protein A2975_03440 [Candidatus Woesebacteria bacterium RIFCSPLOWO2_01_FULL_44_14]